VAAAIASGEPPNRKQGKDHVMGAHYTVFTPEGMVRLADLLQADEHERREFCRDNRIQTQQLMERFRSERHEAGRTHARERAQLIDDLRAGARRFREQCDATGRERAEQSRELAREHRATSEAFHDAQRTRRGQADERPKSAGTPATAVETMDCGDGETSDDEAGKEE
jgi:hypothetical protein